MKFYQIFSSPMWVAQSTFLARSQNYVRMCKLPTHFRSTGCNQSPLYRASTQKGDTPFCVLVIHYIQCCGYWFQTVLHHMNCFFPYVMWEVLVKRVCHPYSICADSCNVHKHHILGTGYAAKVMWSSWLWLPQVRWLNSGWQENVTSGEIQQHILHRV